jgi:hypothetical protein
MTACPELIDGTRALSDLVTLLPGPGRKRTTALYRYRVAYRNPDQEAIGCVILWEVTGGRTAYQVALERDDTDNLYLHCTCADAVFHAEDAGRFCKHMHGLLQFGRPLYPCPQPVLEDVAVRCDA